jgi:hypothetical protein
MDPLSITLAVITLATALKDIIETAEIIQDSFSKVHSSVTTYDHVLMGFKIDSFRRTIEMRIDLQKRYSRPCMEWSRYTRSTRKLSTKMNP